MKKSYLIVAAVLILLFALLVWPTPFVHTRLKLDDAGDYPVMINRLTGETYVLSKTGWIKYD